MTRFPATACCQLKWVPLSTEVVPLLLEILKRVPMHEDTSENTTAVRLLAQVLESRDEAVLSLLPSALLALAKLHEACGDRDTLEIGPAVSCVT